MECPFHDGRVGDGLAAQFDDEMNPTDGVLPVVVGERLLLVRAERGHQHLADRSDLGRAQILGPGLADLRRIGHVQVPPPQRSFDSAIRARTIFLTSSVGRGLSGVNRIVPLEVSKPWRSASWATMTSGLIT